MADCPSLPVAAHARILQLVGSRSHSRSSCGNVQRSCNGCQVSSKKQPVGSIFSPNEKKKFDRDVFFLPAQGVVRSPADFGDGLRKGSSALFQGTVGTVLKELGKGEEERGYSGFCWLTFVSTATSLASTVAAKLTLDEDYKKERQQVSKNQAKTAGQGFLYAARDVGKGGGVVLSASIFLFSGKKKI